MILATIRSDFRKLLTVRSTYILLGLCFLIAIVLSFYFEGYKGNTGSEASKLGANAFMSIIKDSSSLFVTFTSIIVLLFIGHEYRYNTILYTLTANAKRTKVFFSKVFVVTAFSLFVGYTAMLVSVGAYALGVSIKGAELPPQNLDILSEFGKVTAYFLGYGLMSLIIAFLIRSVVGAIAFFFIVPATVESLLSLVLKEKSVYLPFTSLDNIMGTVLFANNVSPLVSALTGACYVVVGGFVSWLLFIRRDAN